MGYENPKIAVLAATETVNSKVVETVDAANLQEMNRKGRLPTVLSSGLCHYDLAMSQGLPDSRCGNVPTAGISMC